MRPFLRLSTPHPVRGDSPTRHSTTSHALLLRPLVASSERFPSADAAVGFSLCEVEGVPRRLENVMAVYEYLPEEIEEIEVIDL